MSCWTYVTGVIDVDTFARSDAEAMYLAQTVANHLPRITGSEGDAKFYFSRPEGYCTSSNVDEFENPVTYTTIDIFVCLPRKIEF